jgi:hypothetical protein
MSSKISQLLIVFVFFYSCTAKEKVILGYWKNGLDTICLKQENRFSLYKSTFVDKNQQDGSLMRQPNIATINGMWELRDKSIYLIFSDTSNFRMFSGCKNLQISRNIFGKIRLFRSNNCYTMMPAKPIIYSKVR